MDALYGFDVQKYSPDTIVMEDFRYENLAGEYLRQFGYYLDCNVEYNFIYRKDVGFYCGVEKENYYGQEAC